jgi:hypothetical protein
MLSFALGFFIGAGSTVVLGYGAWRFFIWSQGG